MAVGARVYDTAGVLLVDTGDRVGKILGMTTTIPGTTGSITVAEFVEGEPFFVMVMAAGGFTNAAPPVSISGTTLYWGNSTMPYYIIFGIY